MQLGLIAGLVWTIMCSTRNNSRVFQKGKSLQLVPSYSVNIGANAMDTVQTNNEKTNVKWDF